MTLGNRISQYRKEKGLTQEGLAQALGVTNQAVSKWESDQNCPDVLLLPKIAEFFGISLDALFGRELPAPVEPQPREDAPLGIVKNLPWPDDKTLRVVIYKGHTLLKNTPDLREAVCGNGATTQYPTTTSCFTEEITATSPTTAISA